MIARSRAVGFGVVALTVAIALWRVVPASSESDRLAPHEVADVVALLHHDQQGITLAHQAAAQSPAASTRRRSSALAGRFQVQARALTAALDAHHVPTRERLVDTARVDVVDESAVGCDLMPSDAVSRLAATPPDEFDAQFSSLMGRHLAGGRAMAAAVLEHAALGAELDGVVRGSQEGLG